MPRRCTRLNGSLALLSNGPLALLTAAVFVTATGCRSAPSGEVTDASNDTAAALGASASLGESSDVKLANGVNQTASGIRPGAYNSPQTRRAVATRQNVRDVESSVDEFPENAAAGELAGAAETASASASASASTTESPPRAGNRWTSWVRGWTAPSRNTKGRTLPPDSRPSADRIDGETAEGF